MKSPILLLALSVAAFSSCTTAYRSGQTPDDVYYSAAKPQDDNEQTDKKEENQYTYNDQYYNDRFLRMKVHNRTRWSELNDWYYYDKYSFASNYYWGSYNNPYNSWNFFYNPYCCCHNSVAVINSKIPASLPVIKRNFNLAGYTQTVYNNSNNTGITKTPVTKAPVRSTTKPAYDNSNGLSDKLKSIFSNENSGNGSSRIYTPSSSSTSGGNNNSGGNSGSSGKSGSSSGSGTVTRPVRN